MTQSPCYDEKTRTDCPRRCVGCKISCPEWAEWVTIHERERAEMHKRRRQERDADGFMIEQGKRVRLSNQAKFQRRGRQR